MHNHNCETETLHGMELVKKNALHGVEEENENTVEEIFYDHETVHCLYNWNISFVSDRYAILNLAVWTNRMSSFSPLKAVSNLYYTVTIVKSDIKDSKNTKKRASFQKPAQAPVSTSVGKHMQMHNIISQLNASIHAYKES